MIQSTETLCLNVPLGEVNLKNWLYNMTDMGYQSFSRGHWAMGAFKHDDGTPGFICVEKVANTLQVQHYKEEYADAKTIRLHSSRSRGYFFWVFPTAFSVTWEVSVEYLSDTSSLFKCHIEASFPNKVHEVLARLSLVSKLMQSHNKEETRHYVADIENCYENQKLPFQPR
jgi:hypothetical protein